MDDDEQSMMASTIAAHEVLLSLLLTDYLTRKTPEQRLELASQLEIPATLRLPPELSQDLDAADHLAGLLIGHQEAVRRIMRVALERVQNVEANLR